MQIEDHNAVFRNLGNGKWSAVSREAGLAAQPRRRHRGAAFGDFDNDGRIDVVVTALGGPAEIWMNRSPGPNHWLDVELTATAGRRSAIGAEIRLATASGTQHNHVTSAVGYASSSAGPVHFGLGKDDAISLLEVRWPNGRLQRLTHVKPDSTVKLHQE
jgi:hypothetical protein